MATLEPFHSSSSFLMGQDTKWGKTMKKSEFVEVPVFKLPMQAGISETPPGLLWHCDPFNQHAKWQERCVAPPGRTHNVSNSALLMLGLPASAHMVHGCRHMVCMGAAPSGTRCALGAGRLTR